MTTQMPAEIEASNTTPAVFAPEENFGKLEGEALQAEMGKRQWLCTRKPEVINIRILAMGKIHGLEEKERNDEEVAKRTVLEATKRGLNPQAIRGEGSPPDAGFQFFEKVEGVRTTLLLPELEGRGYVLDRQYQERNPNGKGHSQTLVFLLKPDNPVRMVMHPELRHMLVMCRWNHATVWANPRTDAAGRSYRLDNINLAKAVESTEPYRSFSIAGKGTVYRML